MSTNMMPYAAQTTGRNFEALKAAGWAFMVSPDTIRKNRFPVGCPYAIDNGAWAAFKNGTTWDPRPFMALVEQYGEGAEFVVAPDIVAGGLGSLSVSVSWLDRLSTVARVLIPVQDGMTPEDVRPYLSARVGLFVGGSTEWKLDTLGAWGDLAAETGAYLHVGRVNTRQRIRRCAMAGADSFDGSGVSIFTDTILPRLQAELSQTTLAM